MTLLTVTLEDVSFTDGYRASGSFEYDTSKYYKSDSGVIEYNLSNINFYLMPENGSPISLSFVSANLFPEDVFSAINANGS